MSKIFSITVIFIVTLVYILFFNILYFISPYVEDYNPSNDQSLVDPSDTSIGFGESIKVTVEGKRLFGLAKLKQTGTINRSSILYIFWFIPLPLEFGETSFKYFHIAFFLLLLSMLLVSLLRRERRDYLE